MKPKSENVVAQNKILSALGPLEHDDRLRVLKAVCILLDIPLVEIPIVATEAK